MTSILRFFDRTAASTERLWAPAGQWALAVLGAFLAADRADDLAGQALLALPLGWEEPTQALDAGAWLALAAFLLTATALLMVYVRAGVQITQWRAWRAQANPAGLLAALCWAPLGLAGAWLLSMATEDALLSALRPALERAPTLAEPLHTAAFALGALAGLLAAWRLVWPALRRLSLGPPPAAHWRAGLAWPALLVPAALLAARHGLPIWGWL